MSPINEVNDTNSKENGSSSSKRTKNKKKGRLHLSVRLIIVAMIIALLFLLNWDGLHFGGRLGDLLSGESQDTQNAQGTTNADVANTTSESKDNSIDASLIQLVVIVRGEQIFIQDTAGEKEVTLSGLVEILTSLGSGIVSIQDDGAILKVYNEVVAAVDTAKLQIIETTKP